MCFTTTSLIVNIIAQTWVLLFTANLNIWHRSRGVNMYVSSLVFRLSVYRVNLSLSLHSQCSASCARNARQIEACIAVVSTMLALSFTQRVCYRLWIDTAHQLRSHTREAHSVKRRGNVMNADIESCCCCCCLRLEFSILAQFNNIHRRLYQTSFHHPTQLTCYSYLSQTQLVGKRR